MKSSAQQVDSLIKVIRQYGEQNATSSIFVHFDKNIYSNNDQVWFTGYLLEGVAPISDYHTLHLALINNVDSSVVLQKKFLIREGFAFGDLVLPDSLPSGSYRFVVNTNIRVAGFNVSDFIQPITIKSTTKNPLEPSISIFKSYNDQTQNGTVLLKVLTSDHRFVENAEVKYTIGRDSILKRASSKTNVIGELMIDFPANKISAKNNLLSIAIKKENQVKYLKHELPIINGKKIQINFYPESGYLVDGLLSKVGIEIRDLIRTPLLAKAVLYENDKAIDTVNTNSTGLGFFSLIPNIKFKYSVKILTDDIEGDYYNLPPILSEGVVMHANNVIADKDFRLKLQSSFDTQIHVVVHNYTDLYLHSEIALKHGVTQNVRLDLDSVPMGLNAITLLDSDFKPLAERIFFSHYEQTNQLQISTDKTVYGTRDSVRLDIHTITKNKNSRQGLVSVSCTQANRFSQLNNVNIVDYALLERDLVNLPANPMGMKITDREYLNNVLLVKGWRRYHWPMLKDSLFSKKKITNEEVTGQIRKGKKNVILPMELFTIAKSTVHTVSSDSSGKFKIPSLNLITDGEDEVWVSLNHKNASDYTLDIQDPAEDLKKNIRAQHYEELVSKTPQPVSNQIFNDPRGINLKEVTIKSDKSEQMEFASNGYKNNCGDYVCPNNILNCVNHYMNSENISPKEGAKYRTQEGGTTIYHNCIERKKGANISILQGIKLEKEFYKFNLDNKDEPIKMSTIFWDYQRVLDSEGKASLNFTTGDLIGRFKIVVQGVTNNGPIYGEHYITIKRP